MVAHLAAVMCQLLSVPCVQTKVSLWKSVQDPESARRQAKRNPTVSR